MEPQFIETLKIEIDKSLEENVWKSDTAIK
jgi:hypothetical protein